MSSITPNVIKQCIARVGFKPTKSKLPLVNKLMIFYRPFQCNKRGVNRQTDRQSLKIFLRGFRIQSKILTDFRILQLQRVMQIHLFFGPGFWTLRVIQIFLPAFRIQGKI